MLVVAAALPAAYLPPAARARQSHLMRSEWSEGRACPERADDSDELKAALRLDLNVKAFMHISNAADVSMNGVRHVPTAWFDEASLMQGGKSS
jgi:hypothetical protein